MLKIKDNVDLQELKIKYELAYDNDSDYEGGWTYETLDRDGVFIDLWNRQINGIDATSLEVLYDLIQAGLVEKVEVNDRYIYCENTKTKERVIVGEVNESN